MATRKKKKAKKKKTSKSIQPRVYYTLNRESEFFPELNNLLLKFTPSEFEKLAKKISEMGNIKLAIASGIFLDKRNCPADLLVVAKKVKQPQFANLMRSLGVEMGKEISYSIMTEEEFFYRKNMYDKFFRLLIGSPHKQLINKFGYLGK